MKYRILIKFIVATITVFAIIIGAIYIYNNKQNDFKSEIVVESKPTKQISFEIQETIETNVSKEEFAFDELNPDYREAMRRWVMAISETAKDRNADFIIIPQNCSPLLTYNGEIDGDLCLDFINAIDGLGQESTNFGSGGYNNNRSDESYEALINRLNLGKQNGLAILSIDYCDKKNKIEQARNNNDELGYIGFQAQGFELTKIQTAIPNLNNDDVKDLNQAKNALFILNPQEFKEKEEYIVELCKTNYDIIVIDANFNDVEFLTSEDVDRLKHKATGKNRIVISYLSIGEAEDYRYYWKEEYYDFSPSWMLTENPKWEGNYPVMYWDKEWQDIIALQDDSYLNRIIDADFDGVYLDIVDGYQTFED